MVSDLSKDETRSEEQKRMIKMMGNILKNQEVLHEVEVRDFIEGFAE